MDVITEIVALLPPRKIAQHSCVCRAWSAAAKHPKLKQKVLLARSWRAKNVSPVVHKLLLEPAKVCGVAQNGTDIAIGGRGFLKVWNAKTESISTTCVDLPYYELSCVCWVGGLIVGGDQRGKIHGWESVTGKKALQFVADACSVHAIENMGGVLATGGQEHSIKLWKQGDWVLEGTLQGHTHAVCCLAQSGDGTRLVSGSCDASIRVWETAARKCVHILHRHTVSVSCLSISGDVLVSGSEDETLCIWSLTSGQCFHTLTGHGDWLTCVDLNGKLGTSGAWDKTVTVWNADEDECLQKLTVSAVPKKVWFDGGWLLAVTSQGELWAWDFSINQ